MEDSVDLTVFRTLLSRFAIALFGIWFITFLTLISVRSLFAIFHFFHKYQHFLYEWTGYGHPDKFSIFNSISVI